MDLLFLFFLVSATITESVNAGKNGLLDTLLCRKGTDTVDRQEFDRLQAECRQLQSGQRELVSKQRQLEEDHERLQNALRSNRRVQEEHQKRSLALQQPLTKWKTEEQRLQGLVMQASSGKWTWESGDSGFNKVAAKVPWLFDIGNQLRTDGRAFIRYCSVSLIDPEDGTNDYILITSAVCVHLLQENGALSMLKRASIPGQFEREPLGSVKYHREYTHDMDPNVAILRTDKVYDLMSCTPKRLYLPSPHDDTSIQSGLVAWRSYHYDAVNGVSTPGVVYKKRAGIHECNGRKQNMVFCAAVLDPRDEHPTTDLGGSPFYTEGTGGRLILRGIRTGLEGDRFTDIVPFANWIREQAKDRKGWTSLADYS